MKPRSLFAPLAVYPQFIAHPLGSRCSTALLIASLTCGSQTSLLGSETDAINWRYLEVGVLGSFLNLEGPGVTGYNEKPEGADDWAAGGYLRTRYGMNEWFHLAVDMSAESVAGEVALLRTSLAPGAHWQVSRSFALFAEVGIHAVHVEGLRGYGERRDDLAEDTDGGSDVGVLAQAGFRHRPSNKFEWHMSVGYIGFGQEDYPDSAMTDSSPGDGPIYELGMAYDINQDWALAVTWQGTWVEDGGHKTDLATQSIRIGSRFNF